MSKKHLDYWQKRVEDILRYADRTDVDAFAELAKIYNEESKQLQKELYSFYTRYAEDNNLSYQEATQRLRREDLSDYRENARRYREQAQKDPELLKRLNEQYAAARATRLDVLNLEATWRAGILAGKLQSTFEKYLMNTARYAYKKAAGGRSGAVNEPALRELVHTPFNGQNYSQQLWGHTDRLAKDVKEVLRRGFIRGENPRTMAQQLAQKYNVAKSRAQTLLRTDGTAIISNSVARRYLDAGLKYYCILVHLDDRTTQICRNIASEDKLYVLEDMKVGVNAPPFHYNCRSGIVPDEDELNDELSLEKTEDKRYNNDMETTQEIANSILNRVHEAENTITRDMEYLASRNNSYLAGLDFRIKSFDSLVRKIETDSLLDDISLSEAGQGINDALRYTAIFTKETFSRDYLEMKDSLMKQGYEIVKVKNTWLDDGPYKGVNTILSKDGLKFEMQYHTEESFKLKNGRLHELYEERRLPSTSRERRLELDRQMLELSRKLDIPLDIERVR